MCVNIERQIVQTARRCNGAVRVLATSRCEGSARASMRGC
jgi:hypothetical protein